MKSGDTFKFVVKRKTSADAPATGKVLADFSIAWLVGGVVTVIVTTCTEVDTVGIYRRYMIAGTLPAAGPYSLAGDIVPASGTDVVADGVIRGEIEGNDFDSIAALASSPTAGSALPVSIGGESNVSVVAYRENPFAQSVVDQNGDPVDLGLTKYSNWRFSVWDKTHAASIYLLSSGITGDVDGNVAFTIPENASFYSQIAAALAAGQDSKILYYDVIADYLGAAGSTRPILRGQLTLLRYEGAP